MQSIPVASAKLQVALSKLWCLFCLTTPALVREIEGVPPSISLPPALHLSSLRFASTASGQISMASAVNPVTQKIKCPSQKGWVHSSYVSSCNWSEWIMVLVFGGSLATAQYANQTIANCELWQAFLWWYWWHIYLKLSIPQRPSFPALPGCSEFEPPGQLTVTVYEGILTFV